MVRLSGYEARYPRQLSGGQQQRVALARAMVFRPRLLLMDEPLGALDKQLRESLQIEIRRLHAELGITFVYVTHDQEEALTMSDRIAVMNEGIVAQLGAPEDLYNRPNSRFVASFIGESNFLPGIVRGIEHGFVVADCAGAIVRAVPSGTPRQGEEILLSVRPERLRFAGATSDKAAENRIGATVTDAVFAGERCRYLLQGNGGIPLVLKEPSGHTARRAPGDIVEVAWAASDTIVV
jgi:ABC-type Fe3+/spermidine/putrescine transport system ATPase subunit